VPVEVAERARAAAAACEADSVVAVGGGSAIGTAKAIALTTELPIVAVPTTYAGSEMTPVWGLTEASRKTTGRSPVVLPTVVVYDPELTLSLPPGLSATSGINALAHGVEAFYAPGASPVSSLLAEEAIRALAEGLPAVVRDPTGLPGRERTLYGAYLAGAAFAVAGSSLHHRICHVLGGAYDLPHAELHTVVLPQVTAFLEPALPAEMARIRDALGAGAGTSAAAALHELALATNAPTALDAIGMRAEDVDEAGELVLESLPPDPPRSVAEADVRRILDDAFHGRRPA
jgi:alcohol dehydrogenase class IV